MKHTRSAKFHTILYFSIVAFALITIHVSVYWHTTEGFEHLYGQNRLDQIKEHSEQMLANVDVTGQPSIHFQLQGHSELDKGTEIVFDFSLLPDWFPNLDDLNWDEGVEVLSKSGDEAYFLMKTKFHTATGLRDAVLLMDFRLYELSEDQLFASHAEQVAISIVILVVSLLVVIKISDRLTRPISSFARTLAGKTTEDLDPVPLPKGTVTRELTEMVEMFNRYLERISALVKRERSFSRYASHEIRTPLTVMKGALTLMEVSDDPEFQSLQRERLNDAVREMGELIETLLSLSREARDDETIPRHLTEPELAEIARDYEHLLTGKNLGWKIDVKGDPEVRMPKGTFRVLLGNLVKNAFTYTEKGEVLIEAFPGGINVVCDGTMPEEHEHIREGFGLGLLLVRDICHRFGWYTEHEISEMGGWTTKITFGERQA